MILVDASIWIDHLNRGGNRQLEILLEGEQVLMHRFVITEIALGSLKDRAERLAYLRDLHCIPTASEAEVTAMIEWRQLYSTGIGYVDAHLLAATLAAESDAEVKLWTRDKRLHAQAERLGVAASL